ncbi:MAG: ribbon-helix-helix protein, CopG family [Pyrinomonadaceae bacterium]
MRTTITIDEDIAARLDELQRSRKISFKKAVNLLLRQGLAVEEKPPKLKPFKIKARSLGKTNEQFNLDKISETLDKLDESEGEYDYFRR